MPSYLRFTPPPLEVSSVRPRLIPFQLACPGTSSRSRTVGTGLPVPNKEDRRLLRVELQRSTSCTVVVPIELARTKEGRWLVVGTDLASIPNPAAACRS